MNSINAVNGQSNYDLTLQVYGNLDLIIKLCNDSSVTSLSSPAINANYDPTVNTINNSNIGIKYKTKP